MRIESIYECASDTSLFHISMIKKIIIKDESRGSFTVDLHSLEVYFLFRIQSFVRRFTLLRKLIKKEK